MGKKPEEVIKSFKNLHSSFVTRMIHHIDKMLSEEACKLINEGSCIDIDILNDFDENYKFFFDSNANTQKNIYLKLLVIWQNMVQKLNFLMELCHRKQD